MKSYEYLKRNINHKQQHQETTRQGFLKIHAYNHHLQVFRTCHFIYHIFKLLLLITDTSHYLKIIH